MATTYTLMQVFGTGDDSVDSAKTCPTYVERNVHKEFDYYVLHEQVHIIICGSSRQGKSWLVAKYCPDFVRIGCIGSTKLDSISKQLLKSLNISFAPHQHGKTRECSGGVEGSAKGETGIPLVAKGEVTGKIQAGGKWSTTDSWTESQIELSDIHEVIKIITPQLGARFILIENFHYLRNEVQAELAETLREFLHAGIRVIIVGIWKDSAKLTNMVSDLIGRVVSLDIGDWNHGELRQVAQVGSEALNVSLSPEVVEYFISICGRNIGNFKRLLKEFCKQSSVYETSPTKLELVSQEIALKAAKEVYKDDYGSLSERLDFLAAPRTGEKGIRYYVVRALLDIINEYADDQDIIIGGIPEALVFDKIKSYNEELFLDHNVKSQLRTLHRKENPLTGEIDKTPIFYFDPAQNKMFVVESSLIGLACSKVFTLKAMLGPKDRYISKEVAQ